MIFFSNDASQLGFKGALGLISRTHGGKSCFQYERKDTTKQRIKNGKIQ